MAIAGSAAVPGYFFGPDAGFAAVCALLVVAAGLVTGATDARASMVAGWLVYAALAGGQAVVVGLVLAGVIADRSLTVVDIPGHPWWHHAAAHLALQLIYLVAFGAARRFQRQYRRLAGEVVAHERVAAQRRSLLAEARAEYSRALAFGKGGVFSGQAVGGYTLGPLLGRGGAGEVYAAVDRAGAPAAVKLLRGDRLDDAAARSRFVDETSLMARVTSDHVVRVLEDGTAAPVPYAALERLDGDDLAGYVARHGPLPPDQLAALCDAVAAALTASHAAGVVHLDVTPRNLVRARDAAGAWRWKLCDFGAARDAAATATATAAAPVGTWRHLAPERLAGAPGDVRADVYGFASTIYTAATGREPGDDLAAPTVAALAAAMPGAPAVSPPLALALAVGLARDPARRFVDVATAHRAFLAGLAGVADAQVTAAAAAVLAETPWRPLGPPVPAPVPPRTVADDASATSSSVASAPPASVVDPAWLAAYRTKMRGFYAAVVALCTGGAALFGLIIVDPVALRIAWTCMLGVVAVLALHRRLTRADAAGSVYWPWAIIGALSVGPAYALGLHSGFAAIIAVVLFAGGLFRGSLGTAWFDRRGWVLAAVVVAHTVVFALIVGGWLADRGNVTVDRPGQAPWEPFVLHGALVGVYAIAFAAGAAIDARQRALLRLAQAAVDVAARQAALLATARAQLDATLAGEQVGIFSHLQLGRYAVGRLLGRGGMGEVYQAIDSASGQAVALKLVRGDRVADPRFLRRFAQEARALATVSSRFVARVHEVGGLDREPPYIAMELIVGASLAATLRGRDRLAPAEVQALVGDVGAGLADLHRAGVIHRDVKPQNLVHVDDGPVWKLVDLGLAKVGDAGTSTARLVLGTPAYMAPEQVLGDEVDARADLYSFTLVVYRALVGHPAYTGRDPLAIAREARDLGPPAPGAGTAADVALALRIGLAYALADRFASADELREVLGAALAGRLPPAWRARGEALVARSPWRGAPGPTAT
ncbi:MAG: serine/threonine-protein kinase [Kofleriaceae bacterium]